MNIKGVQIRFLSHRKLLRITYETKRENREDTNPHLPGLSTDGRSARQSLHMYFSHVLRDAHQLPGNSLLIGELRLAVLFHSGNPF